jgi:hypothetical protein
LCFADPSYDLTDSGPSDTISFRILRRSSGLLLKKERANFAERFGVTGYQIWRSTHSGETVCSLLPTNAATAATSSVIALRS